MQDLPDRSQKGRKADIAFRMKSCYPFLFKLQSVPGQEKLQAFDRVVEVMVIRMSLEPFQPVIPVERAVPVGEGEAEPPVRCEQGCYFLHDPVRLAEMLEDIPEGHDIEFILEDPGEKVSLDDI